MNIPIVNFISQKKSKNKKKGKVLCLYDKKLMLIDWVRYGRTGKYLTLGHSARSIRHDLRPNIFLSSPPTQSISTYSCLNYKYKGKSKVFLGWCVPLIKKWLQPRFMFSFFVFVCFVFFFCRILLLLRKMQVISGDWGEKDVHHLHPFPRSAL